MGIPGPSRDESQAASLSVCGIALSSPPSFLREPRVSPENNSFHSHSHVKLMSALATGLDWNPSSLGSLCSGSLLGTQRNKKKQILEQIISSELHF
jgi:hypothetical protein